MSTNRTKVDWAYYKAQKLYYLVIEGNNNKNEMIRSIASELRRATKRESRKKAK